MPISSDGPVRTVVLMRSDPGDVAIALRLGRDTARKMKQNLARAIGYNTLALPIAAGIFEPSLSNASGCRPPPPSHLTSRRLAATSSTWMMSTLRRAPADLPRLSPSAPIQRSCPAVDLALP